MKRESNWSGDPRMRPAWGECDERLSLAKPGAETGGKQESSWAFKQAADGKLVMTMGMGNRRQPLWNCLVMTAVEGVQRARRGDGHARASRREADWYRF